MTDTQKYGKNSLMFHDVCKRGHDVRDKDTALYFRQIRGSDKVSVVCRACTAVATSEYNIRTGRTAVPYRGKWARINEDAIPRQTFVRDLSFHLRMRIAEMLIHADEQTLVAVMAFVSPRVVEPAKPVTESEVF